MSTDKLIRLREEVARAEGLAARARRLAAKRKKELEREINLLKVQLQELELLND